MIPEHLDALYKACKVYRIQPPKVDTIETWPTYFGEGSLYSWNDEAKGGFVEFYVLTDHEAFTGAGAYMDENRAYANARKLPAGFDKVPAVADRKFEEYVRAQIDQEDEGRGYFISSYDSREHQFGELFVYRML